MPKCFLQAFFVFNPILKHDILYNVYRFSKTNIPMEQIRGRWQQDVGMAKITWLCVGGPADYMFHPADEEDLAGFMQRHPGQSFWVMGAGSNLLVRDGGVRGIVLRLGKGFRQWTQHTETDFEVGAGALDRQVAQHCQERGLSGLEFLYTIPGSIGGALAMNAGCYGSECADRLLWTKVMDPQGHVHRLSVDQLGFSYRHCSLPKGWIFLSACFRTVRSHPDHVQSTMMDFAQQREQTQPLHVKTGGSTFGNPAGQAAWKLIDQAGFRGKTLGGAQFSHKHCNFLINTGHCTAYDLEALGEQARQAVLDQTGITLRWEIIRWGESVSTHQRHWTGQGIECVVPSWPANNTDIPKAYGVRDANHNPSYDLVDHEVQRDTRSYPLHAREFSP